MKTQVDGAESGGEVEIRLLGPVEVWAEGRLIDAGGPRQRCVLAALAADAGRPVTAEALIDRVWGELPPDRVRQTLQVYVARLRKVLEGANVDGGPRARLLRRGGGYTLELAPDHVDLHRFHRLRREAGEQGRDAPSRAASLRQALALWRDVPLVDLASGWAEAVREAWQRQRLDAVVAWAEIELCLGHPGATIDELTAAVSAFPLAEAPVVALMRALYAASRGAEALDCYAALHHRLVEAVGCDPGPEAQHVQRAILRGDLEVPTAAEPVVVPAKAHTTPAQLPADVPAFTGRRAELEMLDRLLEGDSAARTATVSGTAGVGKTALAVHWAHRVADRFPDGQLYLNLRGYDPTGRMMAPSEAVRDFLIALGTPAEQVPHGLDAQAALLRSLLAGRRVLVVLDNARDAEQVRPLLAGTPTAMTVVTSRDQLTPLVVADGAHPIAVPTLSDMEAHDLLARRLGAQRVTAEPEAVQQIIAACARLPLALAIASARAQQTGFPLAAIAADLGAAGQPLDALNAGDPASQVRAVFSWSYAALTAPAARLYRLLGLHPGPDVGTRAAASMAGQPLAEAHRLLAALTRANLLVEHVPGRYQFHDLLRAYAAERADDEESLLDRHDSLTRLFDHYLYVAAAAMDLLYPSERHRRPRIPRPEHDPAHPVADLGSARAWLDSERTNLVATAIHATSHGSNQYVTQLATTLTRYLIAGHYADAITVFDQARTASRQATDAAGEAQALFGLGTVNGRLGHHTAANDFLHLALERFRHVCDHLGQARTLGNLGAVAQRRADYRAAADHHEQARVLFQRAGDRLGEARALNNLGEIQAHLGHLDLAVAHHQRALSLHCQAGDQTGEAAALTNLGTVETMRGDHAAAAEHHQAALAMYRLLGHQSGQAWALDGIGTAYTGLGRPAAAAAYHYHAREIFDQIGERDGLVWALNGLGEAAHMSGRHERAIERHTAALAIALDIDASDQQARAHDGMAQAYAAAGDLGAARHHWQQALLLYAGLESPRAELVRAHLAPASGL